MFLKNLSVHTVIFLILVNIGYGQVTCLPDTTHTLKTTPSVIENFLFARSAKRISDEKNFIPLQIHIIGRESGSLVSYDSIIAENIKSMNQLFAPANLEFYLCSSIQYVRNETLKELDSDEEQNAMLSAYNNPLTVDVFIVEGINHRNACGYASIGWVTDGYIIIQNSCLYNKTLVHEMGHYFNLFHTHETAYGLELADGSNCNESGDLVCDTPADPNLAWKVNTDCIYEGTDLDANGMSYNPPVINIMSYSLESCKSQFTVSQYNRMQHYYETVAKTMLHCESTMDLSIAIGEVDSVINPENKMQTMLLISNPVGAFEGLLSYEVFLTNLNNDTILLDSSIVKKSFKGLNADTTFLSLHFPPSLKEGIYTLNAIIDFKNQLLELTKFNNISKKLVTFRKPVMAWPDLAIHSDSVNINAGNSNVQLKLTLVNTGKKNSPESDIHIFISTDSIITPSDVLAGQYTLSPITAGDTILMDYTISLPVDTGNVFYLLSMVDLKNQIKEINELNNFSFIKLKIKDPSGIPAKPDYTILNHEILGQGKNKLRVLDSFSVAYTISNISNGKPGALMVGSYLSKDDSISIDDILLTKQGYLYVDTLLHATIPMRIPLGTPPGEYKLIARADEENFSIEENENNNTYVFPLFIESLPSTDLVLESIEISKYKGWPDQSFTFRSKIVNKGEVTSKDWQLFIYLRKDRAEFELPYLYHIDPDFLSDFQSYSLKPEEEFLFQFESTAKKKFEPGKYFIGACVNHEFPEEYWENNCVEIDTPIFISDTLITSIFWSIKNEECTIRIHDDQITITAPEPALGLNLFNTQGKLVQSNYLHDVMPVSGLPNGTYLVEVITTSQTYFKKIIIH